MGGSLALALHKKCAKITGYDIDPNVTSMADEKKIVDQATTDLHKAVQDANLIILAAPVKAILTLLKALSDFQEGEVGEAVILDLGSTKVQITEMMENLPAQFDPIGGHPMCGKETSGLINAEPGLFHRKVFALTPLKRTSANARALAESLVKIIGALPVYLDPVTHDEWTASISHLPYILSVALTLATPLEAAPLIGPGFRSTTRIAASSPIMMMDILLTNKDNIISAIQRFRQQFDAIEEQLKNEELIEIRDLLSKSIAHLNQLGEFEIGENP